MRKFGVFIITVFVALSVCVMTGCPDNTDNTPSSMTFEIEGVKEFTIYSNFDLTVKFFQEVEIVPANYSFKEGDTISAKITGAGTAWDNDFSGEVEQMTTINEDIDGILKSMGITAEITLTYEKDNNGEITGATVLTKDAFGNLSNKIMGGEYTKK